MGINPINFADTPKSIEGVSVIICCYNSSARLPETLRHLACQKTNGGIPWEILIINNASKDTTKEVAKTEWENYNSSIPFYIIDQPIPGLSHAREKGIEIAKYEYLLFCDDDNWLNENYIERVFEIMASDSKIGALGGLGIPEFETEPDTWIKENAGVFATGPQGETSGEVTGSQHVYGAGSTYRKSAIEYLKSNGFEYQLTGRKGDKLLAGEDHELCYALYLAGYVIWYDENLKFQHFIPSYKINKTSVINLVEGFIQCGVILKAYKSIIKNGRKNKIKTSWIWIYLNMLLYIIRNIRKRIVSGSNLMFTYSIKELNIFYLERSSYIKTRNILLNAAWIKQQI